MNIRHLDPVHAIMLERCSIVTLSVLTPPPLLPTEGAEGQMSAEEEEARRIAEMGKPILGEHSRMEVVIEESYEFKVDQRFLDL